MPVASPRAILTHRWIFSLRQRLSSTSSDIYGRNPCPSDVCDHWVLEELPIIRSVVIKTIQNLDLELQVPNESYLKRVPAEPG